MDSGFIQEQGFSSSTQPVYRFHPCLHLRQTRTPMEPTNAIPARMNIMNPGVGGFDVLRRLFDQNRVFHNILSFQLIYGRRLCPVCGRIPDGTRKYPAGKGHLSECSLRGSSYRPQCSSKQRNNLSKSFHAAIWQAKSMSKVVRIFFCISKTFSQRKNLCALRISWLI